MSHIEHPGIDIIDICVPTTDRVAPGLAALERERHTLIEKPLARTARDAQVLFDAADAAWVLHGTVSMCAMCMRFWPRWDWLKSAVAPGDYGRG